MSSHTYSGWQRWKLSDGDMGAGIKSSGQGEKLSNMAAGRASTTVLCLLCIGLAAAALPSTLNLDERDTCYSALDTLQSCKAGLALQDLQQLCCIPFHALEGMNCFW